MEIGNVKIPGFAGLAPMAGAADKPSRKIYRGWGAGYSVSEMVSAKGITYGDRKSFELLSLDGEERPAAIQLFGCDPDTMAKAAQAAMEFKPDIIDINMGCPATKIVKGMAGSRLMTNPTLAGEIVKAVVDATDVPVTVKMRAGWDSESINAVQIAQIAEQNGASAVTVHGRTREQQYSGKADTEIIRKVKQSVSIPVIGNGDINSCFAARHMIEETNCDYLLVGRGALGRPWLFAQINAYLKDSTILPDPPVSQRMLIMLKHIQALIDEYGEKRGMLEARKQALWYTKGIPGAARHRRELSTVSSMEQLQKIALEIIEENPRNEIRLDK